jgi:hypothetical protein
MAGGSTAGWASTSAVETANRRAASFGLLGREDIKKYRQVGINERRRSGGETCRMPRHSCGNASPTAWPAPRTSARWSSAPPTLSWSPCGRISPGSSSMPSYRLFTPSENTSKTGGADVVRDGYRECQIGGQRVMWTRCCAGANPDDLPGELRPRSSLRSLSKLPRSSASPSHPMRRPR